MKYLTIGVVVFIVCMVAFAPAGLMDSGLNQVPNVDMTRAQGTIWRGKGGININGNPLGDLSWQLKPWSLLVLSPSTDFQISGPQLNIQGAAGTGLSTRNLQATGQITSQFINNYLAPYLINLNGNLDIVDSQLVQSHDGIFEQFSGQINWQGGQVSYAMSGLNHQIRLPPLVAYLDQDAQGTPIATVYGQGESDPLILASLGKEGFVKIGITKRFTTMLNQPWPGNDPDHTVVIEVEEKFF